MTYIKIFYEYFITYGGYKDYFTGLKNTAIIAVFGLLIGFVIGFIIATVKIIPQKNSHSSSGKGVEVPHAVLLNEIDFNVLYGGGGGFEPGVHGNGAGVTASE